MRIPHLIGMLLLSASAAAEAATPVADSTAAPVAASSSADPSDITGPTRSDGLRIGRLAIVGAGGGAAHFFGYRYAEKTWWQGRKTGGIHFINDWSGETFLNLDKAGHFMSAMFLAEISGHVYQWAGFSPRTSILLGSLTSFGELFLVEWRDGRFDQWGFSIPDLAADAAGAAVPLIHTYFPATQAVRFKWSYFPSSQLRSRTSRQEAGLPFVDSFVEDYEGMTFWMTLDVKRMFGLRHLTAWPNGLGLAIGWGATGMHGANAKSTGPNRGYPGLPEARHEIFLSVDYHAPDLPGQGPVWTRIKHVLQYLHLPAPAVRIHPERTFYLLYF